jgi:hypothetical protein
MRPESPLTMRLPATERNRRHPAGYSVQGRQPRGLTVKARNCSAAFADSADSAWLTAAG